MGKVTLDERIALAVSQALALKTRKVREPVVPANETEWDRVARVLRVQSGMRGILLRYIVRKGPGVYTFADIMSDETIALQFSRNPSNVGACLTHLAWKMQGGSEVASKAVGPCGYTLAVDGTGVNVRAMLSRTKTEKKPVKPRKAKALPAPVAKAEDAA
jgi:hypothetical protein